MSGQSAEPAAGALSELAAVPWRSLQGPRELRRRALLWTAWTVAVATPFVVCGLVLLYLEPLTAPVALASFAHAWVIPELYAARGARAVAAPKSWSGIGQKRALGLLADLCASRERELLQATGLVLYRGKFGVWLVGEAGALLVTAGGRGVHCFCVRVTDSDLPPSDRTAHLLLALRTDEAGFATVANHVFCGAAWRVRRRMAATRRPALHKACKVARGQD